MVDDLFEIRAQKGEGEDTTADILLHVHVQPGAGRTAVVGRHGTALKVRVAAPPQGGRANEECAELLVETFGVKSAQVELASGASSRAKGFRITEIGLDGFRRRLEQVVHDGQTGPGPEVRQGIR
jgi:uncharacterized protein (TIGR00251 family)